MPGQLPQASRLRARRRSATSNTLHVPHVRAPTRVHRRPTARATSAISGACIVRPVPHVARLPERRALQHHHAHLRRLRDRRRVRRPATARTTSASTAPASRGRATSPPTAAAARSATRRPTPAARAPATPPASPRTARSTSASATSASPATATRRPTAPAAAALRPADAHLQRLRQRHRLPAPTRPTASSTVCVAGGCIAGRLPRAQRRLPDRSALRHLAAEHLRRLRAPTPSAPPTRPTAPATSATRASASRATATAPAPTARARTRAASAAPSPPMTAAPARRDAQCQADPVYGSATICDTTTGQPTTGTCVTRRLQRPAAPAPPTAATSAATTSARPATAASTPTAPATRVRLDLPLREQQLHGLLGRHRQHLLRRSDQRRRRAPPPAAASPPASPPRAAASRP